MTSTATKVVSGTKLFIATLAMLGAGSVALATVPLNYGNCVDSDAKSTFDVNQLFVKSTTTYGSGSKVDYCYTFQSTGKTYLMEGVNRNGSFSTWQKNCAELNLGKTGVDYKCVDGACVNMAAVVTSTQPTLLIVNNQADGQLTFGHNVLLGTYALAIGKGDVLIKNLVFDTTTTLPTGTFSNWILQYKDGEEIASGAIDSQTGQVKFSNLEDFVLGLAEGTKVVELSATVVSTPTPSYAYFQSSINKSANVDAVSYETNEAVMFKNSFPVKGAALRYEN